MRTGVFRSRADPTECALLDPELGQVLSKVGPPRHAKAIDERLKHFKQCRMLPAQEREAIALFAGAIGFTFGFMRPVVHGQNRNEAKKTAITLANIFVRSLCPDRASLLADEPGCRLRNRWWNNVGCLIAEY